MTIQNQGQTNYNVTDYHKITNWVNYCYMDMSQNNIWSIGKAK